ncbi:hypothetical protein CBM2623_B80178 [Cupriavidus taiwanensis]|nr:hypothetical protein CBM2608_B90181 [Cupriavidus taiwanensis]SPA36567.1 hypothetical protein CBM2623_B80178 [Cupriavidus taiwanensis]SPA53208.1 hypothetical protein CBM2629_B90221 [Cupriavidus taiwanensis]
MERATRSLYYCVGESRAAVAAVVCVDFFTEKAPGMQARKRKHAAAPIVGHNGRAPWTS